MFYYTLYNKNDEVIAVGTAHECAKKLAMSTQYFYCMVGRVRNGTNQKYKIVSEHK